VLDVLLDYLKRLLKSRLFPITIIYLVLFGVIVHRIFVLQIVQGPTIEQSEELKYSKTREIKSTRGNIYDRNGKLLASNVLTYSVVMEDSTKIESNEQRNAIIHKLVKIIEKNGDTLDTEFYIKQKGTNDLEFTIKGNALERFKKQVYSFVLNEDKTLKQEQKDATAKDVYEFLKHGTGDGYTDMFDISDEYSVEDTLKIMAVRYALFLNFPKYAQITIASQVSDTTVAAIKESQADLLGVQIQQQTQRVYEDSKYFANIIGYTGLISQEELDKMNANGEYYNATDVIGKTGLEQKFEEELAGIKGTETVSVNTAGKVVDIIDRKEPIAGNDLYLTIDSDLQRNSYHILEKKIAGILLDKIVPDMNYGSKGESATEIKIPIYEVYYALINNNVIDIDHFEDKKAQTIEKNTYKLYNNTLKDVYQQLDSLLKMNNTVTNDKAGEMENYLERFYAVLSENYFINENISKDDKTLADYKNNKISLSALLQYALSNNWVDLSKLGVGNEYYSAEELYQKLLSSTKDILKTDGKFKKLIYRNLIFTHKLSGTEICLLLIDQNVIECKGDELERLSGGRISAYDFIRGKIKSLDITPAMLALEPCSGSLVVTDVNGDVLALVTYPSYDNNKFANKVDSTYFKKLMNDNSRPMRNRPVSEKTAPGSTFKMITSFAALEEGVVSPTEQIRDLGEFTKITPAAKCHIWPSSHGSVDISNALKVSCNYFFYEVGWRLSIDQAGQFKPQLGLSKLAKYATLFGLNEPSGIELDEATPNISDTDSVRSAIGQGSNVYTPIQLSRYVTTLANHGTCYDLTLLDKIVQTNGTVTENHAKVNHKLEDISSTTWDRVLEGMYNVANAPGGSVTGLFQNFGVTVAGKTGTSQISKVDPNNALFVSFAPYENPEISITAVIPNGYTSSNAAELAKDIYKLYFKLDEADKLLEGDVSLPEASNSSAIE
jgi:penicillin-binding protein 2